MIHHLMDMKHPVSKSSPSTIYNALTNQSINADETFDAFAKRLRLMYKTCTRSGIPYNAWITTVGNANVTGKQGAKRLPHSSSDQSNVSPTLIPQSQHTSIRLRI